jgi:hypothetical protein
MTNRITHLEIRNRSLTPAEAEVWITVCAESVTATTEFRGRLMGPSCPYSSTVEVAYPLRALAHSADRGPLTKRVVIPEPSLWEPESPFLYQGPIELWQDGERRDRVTVRHGLCSSSLTTHGLRWNGDLLTLRGLGVHRLTTDNALSLHQSGYNLLQAPVRETDTWDLADRFGFLVLGELPRLDDPILQVARQLSQRPSFFGWLVEGVDPDTVPSTQSLTRLGVAASGVAIPPWATFVVCDKSQVARLATSSLPLLVRGEMKDLAPPVIGCLL